MIYGPDAQKCPIKKQVLNASKEPPIEFVDEMKVCIQDTIILKIKSILNYFSDFLSLFNNNSRWNSN